MSAGAAAQGHERHDLEMMWIIYYRGSQKEIHRPVVHVDGEWYGRKGFRRLC